MVFDIRSPLEEETLGFRAFPVDILPVPKGFQLSDRFDPGTVEMATVQKRSPEQGSCLRREVKRSRDSGRVVDKLNILGVGLKKGNG